FEAQVQDATKVSASAGFSLMISPAPAPSISGISPTSGTVAGGTAVTISGSSFRPGLTVQFGSVSASALQVTNSTQIMAVTPAESIGAVSVTVRDSDGQIAT